MTTGTPHARAKTKKRDHLKNPLSIESDYALKGVFHQVRSEYQIPEL